MFRTISALIVAFFFLGCAVDESPEELALKEAGELLERAEESEDYATDWRERRELMEVDLAFHQEVLQSWGSIDSRLVNRLRKRVKFLEEEHVKLQDLEKHCLKAAEDYRKEAKALTK